MSTNILTVHNLSKSYNIYPIFEGVSFTLNAGEKAALVDMQIADRAKTLRNIAHSAPQETRLETEKPSDW